MKVCERASRVDNCCYASVPELSAGAADHTRSLGWLASERPRSRQAPHIQNQNTSDKMTSTGFNAKRRRRNARGCYCFTLNEMDAEIEGLAGSKSPPQAVEAQHSGEEAECDGAKQRSPESGI